MSLLYIYYTIIILLLHYCLHQKELHRAKHSVLLPQNRKAFFHLLRPVDNLPKTKALQSLVLIRLVGKVEKDLGRRAPRWVPRPRRGGWGWGVPGRSWRTGTPGPQSRSELATSSTWGCDGWSVGSPGGHPFRSKLIAHNDHYGRNRPFSPPLAAQAAARPGHRWRCRRGGPATGWRRGRRASSRGASWAVSANPPCP